MSCPLLLDEMFSDTIAQQLRAKGHDAQAVAADPALVSLPDDQILAHATSAKRLSPPTSRTTCRWTPPTGQQATTTPG